MGNFIRGDTMSAKEQYRKAQHAIRNLLTNGNTVMGHDYFLRRVQGIRLDILDKAWQGIQS
jgi:hypothetical protein